MKNLCLFSLIVMLGVSSCGKKENKTEEQPVTEAPTRIHIEKIAGIVGPGTSMNVLQLYVPGTPGDTLWIEINDTTNTANANLLIGNTVEVLCEPESGNQLVALSISGNQTYAEAVGTWTRPDPVMPDKVMGVQLDVLGKASSINMATLVYESWHLTKQPGEIELMGKSIGNVQTIDFVDTARIFQKDGKMILAFKGSEFELTKQ